MQTRSSQDLEEDPQSTFEKSSHEQGASSFNLMTKVGDALNPKRRDSGGKRLLAAPTLKTKVGQRRLGPVNTSDMSKDDLVALVRSLATLNDDLADDFESTQSKHLAAPAANLVL